MDCSRDVVSDFDRILVNEFYRNPVTDSGNERAIACAAAWKQCKAPV
ncbi:MAG: hypothetical protein ACK54V_05085 [Candidatus Kapaibacterium sp.]